MEQYVIKGGNPLVGDVEIAGAKNAALPIFAAAAMTDETVYIDNIPDIRDIDVMLGVVGHTGVTVKKVDRHKVMINGGNVHSITVDSEGCKKIRGSYYLLGAFLGKYKHVEVVLPGGCDIYMDKVSVGATINVMMAATLAEGMTIIENCAKEPHVVDVASFLNSCGANIKGAGTDVIRIRGVARLHGTDYTIIPDQIEAGTFMFAAAVTKGDVTVKNVIPKHLESVTAKLLEIGCEVEEADDCIRVVAAKPPMHTQVRTLPYPGFPTDMQPQITVALALAKGTSIVTESIFENRFKYVEELVRMGADIKVEGGDTAIIAGVSRYTGASITVPDLRAGAALVIAALAAEGFTTVDNVKYVERGYEDFHIKLQGLGAQIELVETDKEIQKFKLKVG